MKQTHSLPRKLNDLVIDTHQLSGLVRQANVKEVLQFFQSEEFTPELLIYYFMATFNMPGPHQYLTQRLNNMPMIFVESFIPQFWQYIPLSSYMVIKIGSQSMETFLEHLCSQGVANYFKIVWCVQAYSENERKEEKSLKSMEKLERRLEKAMVNGAVTFTKQEISENIENVDFQNKLQKQYAEKEHRSAYITMSNKFLMNMIKLSLTLKLTEPDLRKPFLLQEIKKGNKALKKMRNLHPDLPYYWGIILPFQRRFEQEDPSNVMVRIIDNSYACFNTKTRVPYRILIETISAKEVVEKSNLMKDTSTEADPDDLMMRDYGLDLEAQLREHTKLKHEDPMYLDLAHFQSLSPSLIDIDSVQSDSPLKHETIKPKRRSSWSITMDQTDNPQDKTEKIGDLQLNRSAQKRNTHIDSFVAKSTHLLEQINQKEDNYTVERDSITKKIIKVHGPWGDDWDLKLAALKDQSPFKEFESHRIRAIMVKGGDDLRQELFAMQLIQKMNDIWTQAYLNIYLKPYEIIVTSENSGLLEFVPNTLSMDGLKKQLNKKPLHQFFKEYFQDDFPQAQRNFTESLAGYSIVCYLLQIRDRHNGNILIDNQGHLIHIDFGFMLSTSPGNMGFERAPFKFTKEYLQLLEGKNSRVFEYFRKLMYYGFLAIQKNCATIFQIVEIMMEGSNFHCFKFFDMAVFKERFKQGKSEEYCRKYVDELINASIGDWRTVQYDNFQKMTNGIEP